MDFVRADVDGACRSRSRSSLELELAGTPLNVNPDEHIGWSTSSGAVQYYNHDIEKNSGFFDFLTHSEGLNHGSLVDSDNSIQQEAFVEELQSSSSSNWSSYSSNYDIGPLQEPPFRSWWGSSSELALNSALTLPPTLPQTPPPPTHLREVLERIEALEAVATPATPALTYGAPTPPRRASCCVCKDHHLCPRAIGRNSAPSR
jgi:hypothetical protein